jgi:selenium metabolism protein YedF
VKKTIVITSERMGQGDDELGATLMGSFLRKLCLAESLPNELIFYNSGVKLLAEGSLVLDAIEMLEKKGVQLTACGTCVNHFGLADKMERANIGDMVGIIDELMSSEHVVTV